ncbi:MAG: N-acyl homoserine lactonase family protein [Burkholderiales bacterium]|jgi:glyoxylase-like metal-dependent hydrolase (beta-lactamase superfamily II)|nr:N-acyl homoserine lactonase family protein [Burkholderiales bacterium]
MRLPAIVNRLVAALLGVAAATFGGSVSAATVDRMYILECGEGRTSDVSIWSPGVDVGVAREFSDNCYLIRHGQDWLLWETGISDAVADKPEGVVVGGGILTLYVRKTLQSQLAHLGVAPTEITHMAFSHFHGDHVGNANLFTNAKVLVQRAEYDAAFGPDAAKYGFNPALYGKLKDNPTVKLEGDHDVFGDGSVIIIATPGHTPGHQSLLVRLPKQGAVILSGDMVHFRENWDAQRVPARNFDREQSLRSMERIASLLVAEGAVLWINHDRTQSSGMPRVPRYAE